MQRRCPRKYREAKMMQGWECPKCLAVMSPFHPTCWWCRPQTKNTYGTQVMPHDLSKPKDLSGIKELGI